MKNLHKIDRKIGTILLAVLSCIVLTTTATAQSHNHTIHGKIVEKGTQNPVQYATISIDKTSLYTISNNSGSFTITPPRGHRKISLSVQCLGFVPQTIDLTHSEFSDSLLIALEVSSLRIKEVVVTATTKPSQSTSYTIGSKAIEHTQPLSIADITTLLPGGKSRGDVSLVGSKGQIALRSTGDNSNMMSFGTGVEVDGVRLSSNADPGTPSGFATRSIPLSNVQSVEVISGIPSVEHGDISNGIVKVNTKKGKTPYTAEVQLRPNTKLGAASKGFALGQNGGVMNLSGEYARSISDLASPFTSYTRGAVTLNYLHHTELRNSHKLVFDLGVSGNLGGYDNKNDPDRLSNDFTEVLDNTIRGNFRIRYTPQLSWLSRVELQGSTSYSHNLTTINERHSSAAATASIRTTQGGYHIAQNFDTNPDAAVVLIPAGTWDELSYYDSRPLYATSKLTAHWDYDFTDKISSSLMLGADYSMSKNLGQGQYYDDLRYAPTWREYALSQDPAMHNASVFLQEELSWGATESSELSVMAGLRYDITSIRGSEYGTVGNISPRLNISYTMLQNGGNISNLRWYGGWGRGVKLPSFAMLFPRESYNDRLVFAPGADANNTAFSAYYTNPQSALYNPDLKWQYTDQFEVGMSGNLWGNRISIALFHSTTFNTYTTQNQYDPFAYKLTTAEHLVGCPIPFENRLYDIDNQTGIVTVSDKTGTHKSWQAGYSERKIYNGASYYENDSPTRRWGVEWAIDFARIEAIRTNIRLDGNYYEYQSQSTLLRQGTSTSTMTNGQPYQYIGHYVGNTGVANGTHTKMANMNIMVTTHLPRAGLVFSLRFETTLLNHTQNLSSEAFTVASQGNPENTGGNIYDAQSYTAAYPLYYSTWDDPTTLIPFAEKISWAKDHDPALYTDLMNLVQRSNTNYFFKPRTITPYFSLNLSISKEISHYGTISFYATNVLNNIGSVRSSWGFGTGTLYASGYIPQFYYGLTLRLKI